MTFTNEERRLLILYHSGSIDETADIVRDALNDITDSDERTAAEGLLQKLENMSVTEFDSLDPESGVME